MQQKKVNISGVNTYKLPVLSSNEMEVLFARLHQGDAEARQELIQGNIRLVLSVLQRFKNRGENPDDLFQVGCIGLVKAVDNFRPEEKVHFSTYAVPMIIGEIRRYLRDDNAVRVSRSLKMTAQRVQQVREELSNRFLREPTINEIAEEISLSPEEVVLAYQSAHAPLSLYDPVYNNDTNDQTCMLDLVGDDKECPDRWVEQISLRQALESMPQRERKVLEARFFAGKTQTEIAAKIGISQAQVSRIEKAALLRIRSYLFEEENKHDSKDG